MNYLVVHEHHQDIQMCSHNVMLKKILASAGVNIPIHNPDGPDIAYLTSIYKKSTSDIRHPPTYKCLHSNFLPEKEGRKIGSIQKTFDVTYYNCEMKLSIRETKVNDFFGLNQMSFLCTINLNLNRKQIMKNQI